MLRLRLFSANWGDVGARLDLHRIGLPDLIYRIPWPPQRNTSRKGYAERNSSVVVLIGSRATMRGRTAW